MTKLAETKSQQATLQDQIERLGIPPASICLDWAWRSGNLPHSRRQNCWCRRTFLDLARTQPGERNTISRCDWSQLTLDAESKLPLELDNAAANIDVRDLCARLADTIGPLERTPHYRLGPNKWRLPDARRTYALA
ncbi:MAG: hypothetical protein R3C56_15640 [Pirellulaceae bacterium]